MNAFLRTLLVALYAASVSAAVLAADPKPIAIAKIERATPVDFEKEVLPLLRASCLACHNKDKPKGKLVLETPASILAGGDSGAAVVAGKPEDSLLLKSAAHLPKDDVDIMPPENNKMNAPNLTSEQLGLIALWIRQGATGEVKATAPLTWRTLAERVRAVMSVAVSDDGTWLAAGRANWIDLYSLPAGKPIGKLIDSSLKTSAHRDLVQSLAISPDGKLIASGGYREVKLWIRAEDGWKLHDTIGTGELDSPLIDRVFALDFSRDGKRLAIGGGGAGRSGQIALWSVDGRKLERTIDDAHIDSVHALQFSADGKTFATGSADGHVKLLSTDTGKVVHSFEAHVHQVLGVSLRADGKMIASAGTDNSVRFWDIEKGEQLKQSAKFGKEVTSVRYLGVGNSLVISTGDAIVRTIKEDGAEIKTFKGPTDFVYCVSSSMDGNWIAAGGQDGVVRVWNATGKLIGELK